MKGYLYIILLICIIITYHLTSNRKVTYTCQITAGLLIFKEVKHGLHFTEKSGVKGETVA